MRVLLVSAHYPPNFVSGGTLQPARIARGLADRGHEVSVYTGWLDDDQPALATRETSEDGIPVRWVATSHFVSWSDDRNWDNPEVTADFARVLREVDPDVVHVHSLQGLGVGVVREALVHRARVVVTMHDFWWFCTRTFLVDRSMRPCSLVVDCGDCPCEVGRGWLDRRTAELRRVLAGVDLVLAPSVAAAEVLAANGVPEDRLAVDENGMADRPAGGASPAAPGSPGGGSRPGGGSSPEDAGAAAGPVRFLYTGGPNPLKGSDVVRRMVEALQGTPGWSLVAHGLVPGVAAALPPGAPVEVRPPFPPEALDEVLADADVLLLPSIMRETYSLATREALMRGVPVVCTDALGPEEVVRDGVNGLVVPAHDPEGLVAALASAVRSLAADRSLLERLRAGAAAGVPVRPLHDQVDGLVARYQALLAPVAPAAGRGGGSGPGTAGRAGGAAVGAADGLGRVRQVCFVVGIDGAALRYRAQLPAEALSLVGVGSDVVWYHDPHVATSALGADAVVFYRVPATVQVLDLIDRLRERGIPVLFDVDDLIFDPDLADEIPALSLLPPEEADLWLDGVRRYRTTLEAADVFVGSTDGLVAHAAAVVPGLRTERFDNGVGLVGARIAEQATYRPRRPGPLRIGYFSGTDTHDHDWRMVAPAVAEVLRHRPEVELWLGGYVPEVDDLAPFAERTRRMGFLPWAQLPRVLRDLDVNLAPLETDSRFNQAKSAIKWLEAALVATPTVASPTQPFRAATTPGGDAGWRGEVAVLADGHDAWVRALDHLLGDDQARALMGQRARRAALVGWSPHRQGRRYQAILERAVASAGAGADRSSSWVPVAPSEPVASHPRPLPPPDRVDVPWGRRWDRARQVTDARVEWGRRQGRGLRDRARVLWATEGPAGPLRGARRMANRKLRRL